VYGNLPYISSTLGYPAKAWQEPGRSSSKISGKGVTSAKAAALSDEVSASLRDQLLAEVETFGTQG